MQDLIFVALIIIFFLIALAVAFIRGIARSRWDVVLHGSVINRFLDEVRDATVMVVPLKDAERGK
jgi:hypothetical protein